MRFRCFIFLGLLGGLLVRPAAADIVVLVHGYASNANTWEASGISSVLESSGWARGGIFTPTASGTYFVPGPGNRAANKSFSINLPAEAPLLLQADYLGAALLGIRQQYAEEKLILVGHSAGGVVARLVLLGGNPYRVNALITIASPHLGTVRAAQGLDVVDSKPFFCPGPGIDFLKSVFGGNDYRYLKHSRGVLIDLLPASPGSLVFWLNQQTHPDIPYYSVVRQAPFALGDELVPAYSQDMNNVPALHGRVSVQITSAGHRLVPQDGVLLVDILAKLG